MVLHLTSFLKKRSLYSYFVTLALCFVVLMRLPKPKSSLSCESSKPSNTQKTGNTLVTALVLRVTGVEVAPIA